MIPVSTRSKQDFRTPLWFRVWRCLEKFDLDAAADGTNCVCPVWFGPGGVEEDALAVPWGGYERIFCNPPYARKTKDYPGIEGWLEKGLEAAKNGSQVEYLLPANTGTNWFHRLAENALVELFRPRIAFEIAMGEEAKSPPHASAYATMNSAYIGRGSVTTRDLREIRRRTKEREGYVCY